MHVIDGYLARVAAALPVPVSVRAPILNELRDGLIDASEAHRRAGLPRLDAERAAISEFGNAVELAAAFRPALIASQARRVAVGLLISAPLLFAVWTAAGIGSRLGARAAPPWQWIGAPTIWRIALPLAAITLTGALCTATAAIAVTGRMTRWFPDRPRFAPATAAIAGFTAAATDAILLVILVHERLGASNRLDPTPVALAATASLVRFTLAQHSGRLCLAARTTLA